jgi:predicted membrane channel-forming protein YqfA (hemolysin III family)
MNQQDATISKKLRIAGIFIILGLIIESLSLLWNHPLSFLAFLCVGGLFLVVGILFYLLALVSRTT